MILSFSHQFYIFFTAVLTGLSLGLIYDIIRISRRIIKPCNLLVQIEDGVFWIASAIIAFMIMLNKANGEVRPFVLIGTGLGIVVYFTLPSVLIMRLTDAAISKTSRLLKRLSRPVKRKCSVLVYPVIKSKKFLGKKTKKVLHLCKVYAKLKMRHFVRDIKSVIKK